MNVDFYVDKAEKLSKSGKLLDAKKIYSKLLKKYPANVRIIEKLSKLNYQTFNFCNENQDYLTLEKLRVLFEQGYFKQVILEGKKL